MPKPSQQKRSTNFIQLIIAEIRKFNTFPKDINPKVNEEAWLEFKIAYFEAAI